MLLERSRERWSVDKAGKTWTVDIRSDARWHDGTPVTSDDVVFTIRTLQDPNYQGPSATSWSEVTVTATGPRQVRFTLDTPLGGFLQRDLPDDNGAGPGAGPNVSKAYQAPGEDFVSGTQRQLNDGTYGVVISAEPTTVALSRPLLTVLQHERIAAGTPARKVLILERPATGPSLQVMVDR